MSGILESIETWFRTFSTAVPLEVFVFVGSFIEEVISPIPSTIIMGIAGSMAYSGGYPALWIFALSFIANVGKTIAAYGYYFLGDRLEDVVVRKFGKYFGVTHEQVERIGARFQGHWKDGIFLFFLRLLPMVPTTPVSIAAGVIKMDLRVYLVATFLGNFIKDSGYLFIGYLGFSALRDMFEYAVSLKYHLNIAIIVGTVIFLWLLWYHRKRGVWLWEWCRGRSKKIFRFWKLQ